ncbi:site-specific DNA methylase [Amylolactobacillus amylotrophicus DSM 20534]|uniref:Cytosine-specific methyltransferase n=3 Tax=Amylolactobacillus TaxID=2767876 RepID=A0A0R1YKC2_9LACO|nr:MULTISPECIES: DNA (cytosine-5-)-methyltransferase [Amylolactobacillus]APT17879.1 DNA (cytosine-5-)-methyltransferase [Amylolactobacillus amylophilus DSM 20533 = JCM 1125]KRK38415.1 site-specific DNA methylase [Amylolactobacillus amylotrophicus DSM 20534]KRM42942.1 site-specific DNA methylase [Amylolactobacillus amylophilus DSM 20533 = JCM 1125]GED79808.1 cytosine-specific methyltransferase [Amylolactobacillus amylophilus]
MSETKIKVAEMFAGVGGFHLGLRRASDAFEVVWADQYEPGRLNQFAYEIYKHKFPKTFVTNENISEVEKAKIPDMNLLVGGFPCQDYSVASTKAEGLYGKKGVLWWDIKEVIEEKWPQFIFLENVDRLLASPGVKSSQPGRDFGMILKTLAGLGYGATWKMINAADYGHPQRRRRTFIFAFREDTEFMKTVHRVNKDSILEVEEFLMTMAPLTSTLRNKSVQNIEFVDLNQYKSLPEFSQKFLVKRGFKKTGFMTDGEVVMADYEPKLKKALPLKKIIEPNNEDISLYLTPEKKAKFTELKAGFRTTKISKTGFEYRYGMGAIPYPDSLDKPARTMVTSEHTVSRMSHVIMDPGNGKLRLISPVEAEKINTFPKNWTKLEGVTTPNRYFAMGNALVVNLVKEIGLEIEKLANLEDFNKSFYSKRKVERVDH